MPIANFLFICCYLTSICFFMYRLNEKHRQERKIEHKEQIQKIEEQIEKIKKKWIQNLGEMEEKWKKLLERVLLQAQEKGKESVVYRQPFDQTRKR